MGPNISGFTAKMRGFVCLRGLCIFNAHNGRMPFSPSRYMDKLGIAPRLTVSVLVRQAIVGNSYTILDERDNFFPRPASVIFSQQQKMKIII